MVWSVFGSALTASCSEVVFVTLQAYGLQLFFVSRPVSQQFVNALRFPSRPGQHQEATTQTFRKHPTISWPHFQTVPHGHSGEKYPFLLFFCEFACVLISVYSHASLMHAGWGRESPDHTHMQSHVLKKYIYIYVYRYTCTCACMHKSCIYTCVSSYVFVTNHTQPLQTRPLCYKRPNSGPIYFGRVLLYLYIYIYVGIYAYAHICIYVFFFLCVCACAYVCVCVHVRVWWSRLRHWRTHVYIYKYVFYYLCMNPAPSSIPFPQWNGQSSGMHDPIPHRPYIRSFPKWNGFRAVVVQIEILTLRAKSISVLFAIGWQVWC